MENPTNTPCQNGKPPCDIWIYRLVVSFLGAVALTVALGVIVIIGCHLEATPTGSSSLGTLAALGSAAVGALAGLLAPNPNH